MQRTSAKFKDGSCVTVGNGSERTYFILAEIALSLCIYTALCQNLSLPPWQLATDKRDVLALLGTWLPESVGVERQRTPAIEKVKAAGGGRWQLRQRVEAVARQWLTKHDVEAGGSKEN